jgi:hypothetical protein
MYIPARCEHYLFLQNGWVVLLCVDTVQGRSSQSTKYKSFTNINSDPFCPHFFVWTHLSWVHTQIVQLMLKWVELRRRRIRTQQPDSASLRAVMDLIQRRMKGHWAMDDKNILTNLGNCTQVGRGNEVRSRCVTIKELVSSKRVLEWIRKPKAKALLCVWREM